MASNTFDVNIVLDPATLVAIAHMADFEIRSYPNLVTAMKLSLDDLEYEAQDWMWTMFKNPQGPLEQAFEKYVNGPYEAELWNDLPYAQRRNYGFSGMTDVLGRYYADDPGILWAESAIILATPHVEENFVAAYDKTIAGI